MNKIILGIAAGLFFTYFPTSATIIRVPQDQPTIQAGINAAIDGDTVLVDPGTYFEHLSIQAKSILLSGRYGKENTIIRPVVANLPLVECFPGSYSFSMQGFKVTGLVGNTPVIYIRGGRIELKDNNITMNDYVGIWNQGDSCIIDSNEISFCAIGILANGNRERIRNNIIRDCGEGISLWNSGITERFVMNNVVARNGSGIKLNAGPPVLKNNIIAFNNGIGVAGVPGNFNDVVGNQVNYSGTLPGSNDISLDPSFVAFSGNDFHLQSNSPCVDAGDPSSPVPPNGGTRVDMGAFEFELGPAFTLVSPTNASVETTQTPNLAWHELPDSFTTSSFSYLVIYDDTISFSSPEYSPILTDTFWMVSNPLPLGKTFYWKVRATDDSSQVVYSRDTRSFKIDSPPGIPADILPDSGATLNFNSYLVWLAASDLDPNDSVTYQLQIDDNPAFTSPEVNQIGITASTLAAEQPAFLRAMSNAIAIQLKDLTNHSNLKDDSTYFWRVRSVDNHGLGSGYTTGTRSFTLNLVNNAPNSVPGGFSPAGDQLVGTNRPNLSWFAATDPDSEDTPATLRYEVRLDTDGEIAGNFRLQYTTPPGNTSFPIPDSLEENAHWYWAVRTIDSKGGRSAFSSLQSFWVNGYNEPPLAFSLLLPVNGAKLFTKTPTFQWEIADDPDPHDSASYMIIFASDSSFQFTWSSGAYTDTFTLAPGVITRGQKYYWKVSAVDNNSANINSNEVFTFRLLQLGDINGNGTLSPADIVLLLNHVFLGTTVDPPEVADMNCDGNTTPADVVIGLNVVFLGQSPPCDP